jgi:hypothetical protein
MRVWRYQEIHENPYEWMIVYEVPKAEYFHKIKEAELAINIAFKIRHEMWWYNACELPSSDILHWSSEQPMKSQIIKWHDG